MRLAFPQRLLGALSLGDLALRRLVEAGIVDADGVLAGDACHHSLMPFDEPAWLPMSSEKPADPLPRPADSVHRPLPFSVLFPFLHTLSPLFLSFSLFSVFFFLSLSPLPLSL